MLIVNFQHTLYYGILSMPTQYILGNFKLAAAIQTLVYPVVSMGHVETFTHNFYVSQGGKTI
jgi:hypothetical protein